MTPDPNITSRGPRRWLRIHARGAAMGVAVVALLVAAGVFALIKNDSGDPSDQNEAALVFAECVRGQGIEDFPDPVFTDDGGIMFTGTDELDSSEADVQAAMDACRYIMEPFASDDGEGSTDDSADEAAAADWDEITPGGDCACSDGSDFRLYAREANPEKVAFFLDGGGGCWSAATCDPDGANRYQATTEVPSGGGVIDFGDERNPFADYSFVYVPYCTGDVHLGNATTEYSTDLTIHHKGYVNGTAALDYLAETFPDATEIVVMGASAGSAGAPLYAGLVSDRFPDAEITSIGDSSGAFPDIPEFNEVLTGDVWGATEAMSRVPSDLRSFPGLYVFAAGRHPDIVFARYDHADDEVQQGYVEALTGKPGADVLAMIDANEAQIENAGVNLLSYTAPGDHHADGLADDAFYSESVDGVDLFDWVAAVINDESVDDVRCTDCTT